MDNKKTITIGVTGSIAAYKVVDLISMLKKNNYNVQVIMTKSAQEFITPLTLQTISKNKVYTEVINIDNDVEEVKHIELARKTDLFIVVPATANTISKLANGSTDDMLTATFLATTAPKLVVPAMNTHMYENILTQYNLKILKSFNVDILEPTVGLLACGDVGKGKLPDIKDIFDKIETYFNPVEQDLKGINILITAGPTQESIDPVRYITNHSTGKMGYAIAEDAIKRGANVTLISGHTHLEKPKRLQSFYQITSAMDLYVTMMNHVKTQDIVIQSAAVADYTPKDISTKKIKKSDDDLKIELKRTHDVAKEIGHIKKDNQVFIGFAAETNDLLENAQRKVEKKNLDFIVANDLTLQNAGFGKDTNVVKLIDRNGKIDEFDVLTKKEVGNIILDKAIQILENKKNK